MNIGSVHLFEAKVQYDVVDWNFNLAYHRGLRCSVYASNGRIQSWANGYRNNEYFIGVL